MEIEQESKEQFVRQSETRLDAAVIPAGEATVT